MLSYFLYASLLAPSPVTHFNFHRFSIEVHFLTVSPLTQDVSVLLLVLHAELFLTSSLQTPSPVLHFNFHRFYIEVHFVAVSPLTKYVLVLLLVLYAELFLVVSFVDIHVIVRSRYTLLLPSFLY